MSAQIECFFDSTTGTASYLVYDRPDGHAAIIDPVLEYQPESGRTTHQQGDALLARLAELRLSLQWLLETHAHADHLSAAAWLQQQAGGQRGIGARIGLVQRTFHRMFDLAGADDGTPFERLFDDGERFAIGELQVEVLALPGHTPADIGYRIGDAVFVGDTLFMPDLGTARCDFPGGDAATLYRSVRKLYALPDTTRLYLCHDYPPAGRAVQWLTTVAEQRAANIHISDATSEAEFVARRQARDATLAAPRLLLPSIQVNIHAGELPEAAGNGVRYLKIPLNLL